MKRTLLTLALVVCCSVVSGFIGPLLVWGFLELGWDWWALPAALVCVFAGNLYAGVRIGEQAFGPLDEVK